MPADKNDNEAPHPVEQPMKDSHEAGQGTSGEAAKQSIKHDKDLNRSFPDNQSTKKEPKNDA